MTLSRTVLNRLHKLNRSKRDSSDPLCFDYEGHLLCNPRLLGKSKAGRLSWSAYLNDSPVKIYECFSDEHAQFIEDVSINPELSEHVPVCLHRAENMLVVEWVQGKQVTWRKARRTPELLLRIAKLQAVIHSQEIRPDGTEIGFDYLSFLKQRMLSHQGIFPLEPVFERLEIDFGSTDWFSFSGLSHPDVTADNLIIDSETGKLKLVDNELVGQNQYFLVDLFNTHKSMRKFERSLIRPYLEAYIRYGGDLSPLYDQEQVFNAIWSIRLIGSALQKGAIRQAYQTAQMYCAGTLKPSPMLQFLQENLN